MPTRVERHELWSYVAYPHGSAAKADDPERKPLDGPEGAQLLAEHAVRAFNAEDCEAEVVPLTDPDFGRAVRAFVDDREGAHVVNEGAGTIAVGSAKLTLRFLRVSPKIQNITIDFALTPDLKPA